jgi:hypothetical protein
MVCQPIGSREAVCRMPCDKVLKLSDAVQKLPHQVWAGRVLVAGYGWLPQGSRLTPTQCCERGSLRHIGRSRTSLGKGHWQPCCSGTIDVLFLHCAGCRGLLLQVTCNTHGVAGVFLDIGRSKSHKPPAGTHRFTKVRQYCGKTVRVVDGWWLGGGC